MTAPRDKSRVALSDALNGDVGNVDKAVVRGLRTLATALDEMDARHSLEVQEVKDRLDAISTRIIALALSVTGTTAAGVIVYALNR